MIYKLSSAKLYGIVDFSYVTEDAMEDVATKLLAGGVDILQLRAKGIPLDKVSGAARRIIPHCRRSSVPFILNDYPELAMELGADGVHIGQDDGSIYDVRSRIGPDMIIGRSTHSLAQAKQAHADGADYIGFGPLFPTPTKAGRPAIGLLDIAEMEREVGSKIPAFCIGGIKMENLPQVLEVGARRCVIVSQLLTATDIQKATAEAKRALTKE
jgi:thiamine-phosphate pyrophosphorylase